MINNQFFVSKLKTLKVFMLIKEFLKWVIGRRGSGLSWMQGQIENFEKNIKGGVNPLALMF